MSEQFTITEPCTATSGGSFWELDPPAGTYRKVPQNGVVRSDRDWGPLADGPLHPATDFVLRRARNEQSAWWKICVDDRRTGAWASSSPISAIDGIPIDQWVAPYLNDAT